MPKLWKFLSKSEPDAPNIQKYQFSAAADLEMNSDLQAFTPEDIAEEGPAETAECAAAPETVEAPPVPDPEPEEAQTSPGDDMQNPVVFAKVQCDLILQSARQEAEEILRQARQQAQQEQEQVRQQASEQGYQAGFQEGVQQGTAKALEEGKAQQQALAEQLEDEVEAFLKRAETALDQQMDQSVDDLRDLALAVAEKVVCVSLKSSSEVIGKMIQTAVDKRKRRQWVHIYIAECDAKRLTTLPPALASALSELSDHVRIIPMADDESGTCIIECPDEIIDASASTQMQNIRDMLSNHSVGPVMPNFNLRQR